MNKFYWYVRRFFRWASEPRIAIFTVVPIVAVWVLLKYFGADEFLNRLAGFFFQLAGIGTVAWGVRDTRILFEKPSVVKSINNWILRCPKWKGTVLELGATMMARATLTCRLEKWSHRSADDTLDQRIGKIERNMEELSDRIQELRQETTTKIREHTQKISAEEQARVSVDNELRMKLDRSETGGLHISLMGLVWMATGTFLSSFPLEIFKRLGL